MMTANGNIYSLALAPPSINLTWLSALRDRQVDHLGSAAPIDTKTSNETLSFIGWLQEVVHVLALYYT